MNIFGNLFKSKASKTVELSAEEKKARKRIKILNAKKDNNRKSRSETVSVKNGIRRTRKKVHNFYTFRYESA